MEFSFFQIFKPRQAVSGNGLLFSILTIALLLTLTLFGWLIWHFYASLRLQNQIQEGILKTTEFHARVVQTEEILTEAVKMSAKTGDSAWEAKYLEFAPRLDEALQAAKNEAPNPEISNSIVQIEEARRRLAEFERRVFELVRSERLEEGASGLLLSGEYESLKERFDSSQKNFEAEIKEYEKAQLAEAKRENTRSDVLTMFIFAVSACVWPGLIYFFYKFRKNLLLEIAERKQIEEALRESEQRFRSVANSAQDAIVSADKTGKINFWNEGARKTFGYTEEEIIGKSLNVLMPENYREAHREGMRRYIQTGNSKVIGQNVELGGLRKDGSEFPLELSLGLWETAAGEKYFTGVMRDITERKQAEEALHKNISLLTSIFEATADGILVVDRENNIVTFNKKFVEMWGIPEKTITQGDSQKVIKHVLGTLKHPDDFLEIIKQSLEQPEAINYHNLELTDGRIYERHTQPQMLDGNIIGRVLSFRDITERRQAEKTLQVSEERYRSIVETTSEWIWAMDLEGHSTFNNPAIEKVLGYSPQEFLGKNFLPFMHEEDREKITKLLPTFIAEKRGWTNLTCRWLHRDGSIRYLESNSAPILDAEGEMIGFRGADRDITARKRTEDALLRSQSALNATQDGVFMFSPDTLRLFYVNKGAIEQTGYSRQELLQMTPLDIKSTVTEKRIRRILARLAGGKRDSYWLTGVFERKDGRKIPVEIILQYVTSETGEDLFVAMVRDITEREKAKDALQKNLSLLSSTFEATAEGILVVDLDNRIVTYNQKFVEFFKIPEEIISTRDNSKAARYVLDQLINADEFIENTGKLITNPETKNYDLMKFKDGRIYERYNHPQIKDGQVIGRVLSFRDITERKRAEEALRENEEKFKDLFYNAPVAYHELDIDGRFTRINHTEELLLGYTNEELKGRHPWEIIVEKESEESVKGKLSGRHRLEPVERTFIRKDGTFVHVLNEDRMIYDMVGNVIGIRSTLQDITERKQAEEKLQESQKRYQQLFESNPYPIWVYDTETLQILAVNNEALRHYGYSREEFLGLTIKDIRPPEDIPLLLKNVEKAISQGEMMHQGRHLKKDGTLIEVEVASQTITFGGRPARLALITDITERKRADAALRESEYKLRMLLENMNEGLSQVSNDETIEFVNDRFCEMTGYERKELLGKTTYEMLLDDEGRKIVKEAVKQRKKGFSGQYELRLKKKNGDSLWVIVGGAPIVNAEGEVTGSMGVFTDITERKLAEERLLHDALHDGLTGLANRTLFTNHLQKAIERGKRSDQNSYAVLFLDFDRFKVINDSLGHSAGDSLLKQIARRLETSLRGCDLLARLGGDEFTILLNELADTDDAIQVAERIKNDLNTPFMLGEQEVFITASIGIALCGGGHYRAEDMLRDADIAMYRAKAKGKAQHQIFDQTMHKYAINKLQLETEMHHALQRGEFSLNYQPIINLETNSLMGFEALIRWNHPERGMVLPSDFIPIAEENELVIPMGRWILYESCRQMREWQINNPWASSLTISVNLSSKQFLQFDLYEQVAAALISTQLDPRNLKLEITESHVMENSDKAVSVMHRLRETGVEISLDDFGTGYSSLSYLHRLPVNYLKIDRSFVSRMVESKENGEIVHTIVKLAQNLKMKVIAEGIETYEQLSQLKNLGCEYGQGYFISAPMQVEAAGIFISKGFENPLLLLNQPIINAELNM